MSIENIKAKLKELFREGNRRRLVVEKDGKRYANVPLSIVVLACFLVFWLVALLAVIAFFLECKFSLETDNGEPAAVEPEALAVPPAMVDPEPAPIVDLFDEANVAASPDSSVMPADEPPPAGPLSPEGSMPARPARSLDDIR